MSFEVRHFEKEMLNANIEFRRGNAGGGNQLRQPYLKNILGKINFKNFKKPEHRPDLCLLQPFGCTSFKIDI